MINKWLCPVVCFVRGVREGSRELARLLDEWNSQNLSPDEIRERRREFLRRRTNGSNCR